MSTLLIVDDHKMMREGVEVLLRSGGFNENHGFKLLFAIDQPSALKVYEQNKPEISLILTDLSYGKEIGNGLAFIKDIRARNFAIPILLMTTYEFTPGDEIKKELDAHNVPALLKANLAHELIPAIKKALAGRPGFENGASFDTPEHG